VEIKCQLHAKDEFLLKILLLAQHVSGHHYAHHQELESITQVAAACRILCLVFKLSGLRAAALQQSANWTHNPQIHTVPTT
jgi:hypothetical protein